MLVVRNTLDGRALAATIRYQGLKTTTSAAAGFETLTVQVEAASVSAQADTQWQGHEIVIFAREGTIWEGVIEQVQLAAGYYNIFAVGMGLWELSANSIYGIYYDNKPENWQAIATDSVYYTKSGFTTDATDLSIKLGAQQGSLILMGGRYGVEYITPYADSTYGNFKYLSLRYRRVAVPSTGDAAGTAGAGGDFTFVVVGINSAGTETQLLSVVINATDGVSVPFTWTAAGGAGYEVLQIMVQKTTVDGQVLDPDVVLVDIPYIELSLMEDAPTIKSTVEHIIGRLDKTYAYAPIVTTAFIQAPLFANGQPDAGQKLLQDVAAQADRATGTQHLFGTIEGYGFQFRDTAVNHYLITEQDAGEDALYSLVRGQPSVGGQTDGVVTHVRAHYTDSFGIGRFTDPPVATGLAAPRPRLETIEASSEAVADAEAATQAASHMQRSPRGTFAVHNVIKTLNGRYVPVSMVRAGDFVTLNTVTVSGRLDTNDFRRGGIIGSTAYDGDADEVTIELLGNTQ